jgi:subtilisin family serine protease
VKRPRGLLVALVVLSALMVGSVGSAALSADSDPSGLALDPASALAAGAPLGAQGKTVNAVVRLTDPSLAVANAKGNLSKAEQQAYVKQLKDKQSAVAGQINGIGGRQVGQVTKALNALIVSVDRAKIGQIEALADVASVRPLNDYQLDLSETVPYIGAAAAQAAGVTGAGVKVAILDSGLDYTHEDFGGPGTVAAYLAAYGATTADPKNKSRDGLFPTTKAVGGFDFVGEKWPNGGLEPDDDPIDCSPSVVTVPPPPGGTPAPCGGGHGTHVADIIGGIGPAKGVAPGASFYPVKVCSSVSTSCSGVALLQAVDFALDPNGDNDISDKVNVINLSLGSSYGQDEDDLSAALNNASRAGVVVVASAGNSADRPYIVGSPSSATEVISVAQTQVPSAKAIGLRINSPPSIAGTTFNTETVGWAPITADVTGDVAFVGRGCPAGQPAPVPPDGDPYLANPAGKVALIDRGACAVSLKVDRAAKAGAIGVLIGLVAPGPPVSFSFGGGDTFVGTLIITQADSNRIKTALATSAVNVTFGPSIATPLVGSMVNTSSRGPTVSRNSIKPDIGAPGASVSAEVGTGTGETAFGGTSGAAPMVTGSAALMLQKYPSRSPAEIKSALMNTAETNIQTNPALEPGVLAPITRIGGGEVRVKRALDSSTAAWDDDTKAASLSYGFGAVATPTSMHKRIVVRNYSNAARTYSISAGFRNASDAASGAVSLDVPSSLAVGANSSKTFDVKLQVDPSKLAVWNLNGGSVGGDGFRLQQFEYDGYVNVSGGGDSVHVPWQVLLHRAADVSAGAASVALTGGAGSVTLTNNSSVLAGRVDVFALTGQSPALKKKSQPAPGDNFAIVDLESVGVRAIGSNIQFGVDTFGARAHPNYPAEFDVYIDNNRDGNTDRIVFNLENGGFAVTGQNVVGVFTCTHAPPDTCSTGSTSVFFFTDADLNSGNAILTAPMGALGLTSATKFDFSVYAFDNYFTGELTDAIEGMTFTTGTPRFTGSGIPATGVPAGGSSTLNVQSVAGGSAASPSQTGLLLLYRDARGSGGPDTNKQEADALLVSG